MFSWYPNPRCMSCFSCSSSNISFKISAHSHPSKLNIQRRWSTCLLCCILQQSTSPRYLLDFPETLHCFQPTSNRRTSGYCLGTFWVINFLFPPCNNKYSAPHTTAPPASCSFLSLCIVAFKWLISLSSIISLVSFQPQLMFALIAPLLFIQYVRDWNVAS